MKKPAPMTANEEQAWRLSAKGRGSVHLNNSVLRAVFAAIDAERAKVKALREALILIAYAKGDSISGHLPAAECRRVAEAALAATSDPEPEAPSDVHPQECGQ